MLPSFFVASRPFSPFPSGDFTLPGNEFEPFSQCKLGGMGLSPAKFFFSIHFFFAPVEKGSSQRKALAHFNLFRSPILSTFIFSSEKDVQLRQVPPKVLSDRGHFLSPCYYFFPRGGCPWVSHLPSGSSFSGSSFEKVAVPIGMFASFRARPSTVSIFCCSSLNLMVGMSFSPHPRFPPY